MNDFKYPRDFKGVWTPAEVYLDERLTPAEKYLFAEIDSLDTGSGCYASNAYLCGFLKMSHATLERGIKKLAHLELIFPDGHRGRCRVWRSYLKLRELPPSKRGNYKPQNEGPLIQCSNTMREEEPAPPVSTMDYQKHRGNLQERFEKARKEQKIASALLYGMELMHGSKYSNYPKERKAAAAVEKVVLSNCNGYPPVEFLSALVHAYLDRKRQSRAEYWRKAPLSPSGLSVRLDETMEHIKEHLENKEVEEWFLRGKATLANR